MNCKDFRSTFDLNEDAKAARMKSLAHLAFAQEARRKVTEVIVPFNDCGINPPFYCVHPITGSAGSYRTLSALLGPQQRFYGVQTPTRMRNPRFPNSIEAISTFYVEELVAFQPQGAFNLGGHSVGAMIALEMAQQLLARGREVNLLVSIDGEIFNTGKEISVFNPLYWIWLLANVPAWTRDFLFVEFTPRSFGHAVLKKLSVAWRRTKNLEIGRKSAGHAVEGFADLSKCTEEHAEFMKALFEVQYRYYPKKYPGKVLVCSAKTQSLTHLRQLRGPWRMVAPHAEFVSFARVTHTSMIRAPEGRRFADLLIQRLANNDDRYIPDQAAALPSDSRPKIRSIRTVRTER
jgi:pimeloyl-ACP methyl ester carboxylesterase